MMFYWLLALGWIVIVDANNVNFDCLSHSYNLHNSNFFYLSSHEENIKLQCVNEWELPRSAQLSDKLIISPIQLDDPALTLIYNQSNSVSLFRHVNWLIRSSGNCLIDELRSDAPTVQFAEINAFYFLMSFSPIKISAEAADMVVLPCRKHDVSFRQAWITLSPNEREPDFMNLITTKVDEESVPALVPTLVPRDPIKDAFVFSLNEPEGEFMNLLDQLSGAKEMTLGDGSTFTIKTRYTYNLENGISAGWIATHFLDQQLDEVYQQDFLMPNGSPTSNVVGVKLGKKKPDEIVVLGGHFDSISQNPNVLAPGAIDNGSGAVSVMLIASALRNMEMDRTIHLLAFGGEEQGLYGSSHYVDEAKKKGLNIVAALCMDMTAYSNKYFGVKIEGTSDSKIQQLMNIMANNMAEYASKLEVSKSNYSFGSDHVPFQRAGIPAFLAIEMDDTDFPHYHRTTDVSSHANPDQAMGIAKGLAGTLYDLSQGEFSNVNRKGH